MPTYTVTGYQWTGFTTYPTSFLIVIDDDDPDLDWFGGDTGTAQTATFGGTSYNIDGAGLLPTNMQDNDGGGTTLSEELLFMSLPGYGWVFVPLPGSVFTPGDALLSWTTGTWSNTSGVLHDDVMCFTAGTQIVGDKGMVNVEALGSGDMVMTDDHGCQPVRWLSSTRISAAEQLNDPEIRPILIRKNALGPNTPCRDTRVSPQHRVLYSGWKAELYFGATEVLVAAKALACIGLAERDDSLRAVIYVHVLLDKHEILTGDGLRSESLLPAELGHSSMSAAQLHELKKLVPKRPTQVGHLPKLARPEVRVRDAMILV